MMISSLASAIALTAVGAPSGALAADSRTNGIPNDILASLSIITTSGPVSGMPTDLASARAAVLTANHTTLLQRQGRDHCPAGCSSTGVDTSAWSLYGSMDRLERTCNKTMLLKFALFNQIDDPSTHVSISACTANLESSGSSASSEITATCVEGDVQQTEVTSPVRLASSGASSSAHLADISNALGQLQGYSALAATACHETITYAYTGDVTVGIYAGSGIANQGALTSVLEKLTTQVESDGSVSEILVAQLCGNSSARYSLGIMINTAGDLGAVQRGIQSWKNGSCVELGTPAEWLMVTYIAPSLLDVGGNTSSATATGRAECSTVQVAGGDTYFTDYNSESSLCANLTPGQHVCCGVGTLPNFTPEPSADGYCYTYLVETGDSCASIGAAYDLTNAEIESYNSDTWGWYGCDDLLADYNICLSTGYPPQPATVPNAVCGPQVNDTAAAPPGTDFSTMNECPLNACCNTWGQCGTTSEFCTISESSTGAPGTAAPGENGCISNCGTDIVTSDAPSETYNIAYFEAFDWHRSCLRMGVNSIDTSAYTHIHFSFVTLNADYSVNVSDASEQLSLFIGMTGIKKIISLGGWSFSTDLSTYNIMREGVASEANRQTIITNNVNFLNEHELDGIDWDWEYPDEPDIPGIPAGSEADSTGYFLLLDELKQQMPSGKTVSITAPASYWYLQYFPIQALSLVVDYIVYMTYDLHGQWDYTNKYGSSGCISYDQGLGNCLRSHVNLTETINALSMITKAGVPSNMIAVGVSSYGRSFQMETAGCWTEQCTYTGPDSGAYPGQCTNTAGYISNYEIDQILAENPSAQSLWDQNSYSNIVVFNDTQWVAYMDDANKETRKALYPGLNFLGSADWAVDLQSENGDGNGTSGKSDSSAQTVYIDPDIWSSATPLVSGPPGATLIWPPMPLGSATTISFPLWTTTITYSSLTSRTSTLTDGSTSTYPAYVDVSWLTVLTIPPVTTTAIPVWGVTLDTSSIGGPIVLTSSVQPPPFTVIVTPVMSGTTSIIGATETTTSSGAAVIWGSLTYSPPVQTETLGGITTVIGGVTLPPAAVVVTPNPHPTTTPEPGTTDPIINSNKPSWTSADTPKPTAISGCPGCGEVCVLFCDPDCPFCPPGVFGNGGDGEDGDDDDDDDDDSNAAYTIMFDSMTDESFPTAFLELADLSSIFSLDMSAAMTAFGSTTPSTTSKTTTSATTTSKDPHYTEPYVMQAVVCNNEDDFPDHGDVNADNVAAAAEQFCTNHGTDETISAPTNGVINSLSDYIVGGDQIGYNITVYWPVNCVTSVDVQGVIDPLGSGKEAQECEGILESAYTSCNNGGVVGVYFRVDPEDNSC
ncbi:hypothetical protein BKA67DRAFT_683676 [Truncatella angustata]|uniref:chitinase n=1 Tax=Truncatella angustata TaxID=152316 RepID=A0A9P8UE11_9PEZI|nr:uncharacterized protein BKA67DRAFT_683676 [Truncatella angustata]KAH6648205.1 hypothetical protein BKA67DRAFT_683676 [Truncatella angustata]